MWMTLCPISLRIEISRAILEPVWRARDDLQFGIWAEIPDMGKMQCIIGQIASAAAEWWENCLLR
jgi:hypothetical protein